MRRGVVWRRDRGQPDVWPEFPDLERGSPEWNAAQMGYLKAQEDSVRTRDRGGQAPSPLAQASQGRP
jgi:hypothetical protein